MFEPRILETAVAFATDLVDEAGKVDVNSGKQYVVSDMQYFGFTYSRQESLGIYHCIRDSVHDAVALISAGLNPASGNTQPELSLKQSSVKCLLVCPRYPRRPVRATATMLYSSNYVLTSNSSHIGLDFLFPPAVFAR